MNKKKRLKRALIGCVLLTVLVLLWKLTPVTEQLEITTLDYRYANFNRDTKASEKVVVIDIDEGSMKLLAPTYGRWPWPRRVYKEMIEFLSVGEPAAIIFDVLFTEAQMGTDDDKQLAETSASVGMVSHAMNLLADTATEREGTEPLPKGFNDKYGVRWKNKPAEIFKEAFTHRDFALPAPEYMKVIPKIHIVTVKDDWDGIHRIAPLIFHYEDINGESWLPSLSFSGILSTIPVPVLEVKDQSLIISGSEGKGYNVPFQEDGTLRLHYYKVENRPESITIASVIASAAALQKGEVEDPSQLKVNPLEFAGKVLLVGASAAGLEDLKATPVNPNAPGVMVHATAISNVISGDYLKPVPWAYQVGFAIILLVLTYLLVFFSESILIKVFVPLALMSGYTAIAIYLFQSHSIWLGIAMPVLIGLAALFDGFVYVSFVEGKEKKRIKGTLSKYLSPDVTNALVSEGRDPSAEVGDRKELSVLFSDIRGFTTISERFKAEDVVRILNDYLEQMTDVIFLNKGTLDKFIGDCIMAFWGAPIEDKQHAITSVRCGFAMHKALDTLKEKWGDEQDIPINVGVGINTGDVIVGNIGSEKRLDYTVIGDNVNLASRLEGLTKQYGIKFLIGERTEELVRGTIICRAIDQVRVKGKNEPVKIFEPLCEAKDQNADKMIELKSRFETALEAYKSGDFKQGLELFTETDKWMDGGEGTSKVYIDRCNTLIVDPPPPEKWDGVFTATSK